MLFCEGLYHNPCKGYCITKLPLLLLSLLVFYFLYLAAGNSVISSLFSELRVGSYVFNGISDSFKIFFIAHLPQNHSASNTWRKPVFLTNFVQNQQQLFVSSRASDSLLQLRTAAAHWISGIQNLQNHIWGLKHLAQKKDKIQIRHHRPDDNFGIAVAYKNSCKHFVL